MLFFNEIHHHLKYVDDLSLGWTYYMSQGIIELYAGIARNIGVGGQELQKLLTKRPETLEKAERRGFTGIKERIRALLGDKRVKTPPPFDITGLTIYKQNGRELTNREWKELNRQVSIYWNELLAPYLEGITAQGFLLGMLTAEHEAQREHISAYGKQSLVQVIQDRFKGYIPRSFSEVKKKYDIGNRIAFTMHETYKKSAVYVKAYDERVQESIRNQIENAHRQKHTAQELASDMYWMKDDELKQYTAPALMRDFHRIAVTELNTIHTAGKLAPLESRAWESMKDNTKAVYMVFTRGSCEWCQKHQGTIVRLVPRSYVKNEDDDSLASMGIHDPYTTIATWIGKHNMNVKKQEEWRVCTPAHPYNTAVLQQIYPAEQHFNPVTQSVDMKDVGNMKRFIPEKYLQEIA